MPDQAWSSSGLIQDRISGMEPFLTGFMNLTRHTCHSLAPNRECRPHVISHVPYVPLSRYNNSITCLPASLGRRLPYLAYFFCVQLITLSLRRFIHGRRHPKCVGGASDLKFLFKNFLTSCRATDLTPYKHIGLSSTKTYTEPMPPGYVWSRLPGRAICLSTSGS